MGLVVLGVVLLVLRWLEVAPMSGWSPWVMFVPFVLALFWWAWSDFSGRTRRRQEDAFAQRRQARRERAIVAMGGARKGR